MFLPRYRPVLIFCLILLDILIARSIVFAKTADNKITNNVLGVELGPSNTPTFTPTPSPTLTPTPSPTLTPTPTKVPPKPSATPTKAPAFSGGSSSILDQINAFRASKGRSTVQSDTNTCNFAATRAQEISSGFDHSGFNNRIAQHTLPYSGYHEVTENIELNPDPSTVVQRWIDSPGHNANMQKDTPYVCVMSYGNYYAYEGWRP